MEGAAAGIKWWLCPPHNSSGKRGGEKDFAFSKGLLAAAEPKGHSGAFFCWSTERDLGKPPWAWCYREDRENAVIL